MAKKQLNAQKVLKVYPWIERKTILKVCPSIQNQKSLSARNQLNRDIYWDYLKKNFKSHKIMTIYCVQLKSMMNVKPSVIGKYCVVQADSFKFTTFIRWRVQIVCSKPAYLTIRQSFIKAKIVFWHFNVGATVRFDHFDGTKVC